MTQRVDLATVMDRLAVDDIVTDYAIAVGDADWESYRALFTGDGRADHRGAGGIEGTAAEVAARLAEAVPRFPARQHLVVNRRVRIQDLGGYSGDRAEVRADYVSPRTESGGDFVAGGRCSFALRRTEAGWRIRCVVIEERWRRTVGVPVDG